MLLLLRWCSTCSVVLFQLLSARDFLVLTTSFQSFRYSYFHWNSRIISAKCYNLWPLHPYFLLLLVFSAAHLIFFFWILTTNERNTAFKMMQVYYKDMAYECCIAGYKELHSHSTSTFPLQKGRDHDHAEKYQPQQCSVSLSVLINLPFSHFHLIKNNYLYSWCLSHSDFLFFLNPTITCYRMLTCTQDLCHLSPS